MWDQDITTDTGGESIQESTLGYTENRCNGFIKTENQAQREVSKRPSYHSKRINWDLVSGTSQKPSC